MRSDIELSKSRKEIMFPSGKTLVFQYSVSNFLIFPQMTVIILEVPVNEIFNENVFAISAAGDILWQIEKRQHIYENSPYVSIERSGDNVVLYNWDGVKLILSSETGRVISERFEK